MGNDVETGLMLGSPIVTTIIPTYTYLSILYPNCYSSYLFGPMHSVRGLRFTDFRMWVFGFSLWNFGLWYWVIGWEVSKQNAINFQMFMACYDSLVEKICSVFVFHAVELR